MDLFCGPLSEHLAWVRATCLAYGRSELNAGIPGPSNSRWPDDVARNRLGNSTQRALLNASPGDHRVKPRPLRAATRGISSRRSRAYQRSKEGIHIAAHSGFRSCGCQQPNFPGCEAASLEHCCAARGRAHVSAVMRPLTPRVPRLKTCGHSKTRRGAADGTPPSGSTREARRGQGGGAGAPNKN